MAERGIDISGNTTKHLRRYARSHFDQVITLCDKVREICPEFPGDAGHVHWSMADPAAEGADDDDTYAAFERTADELEDRVGLLIADLFATQGGPDPCPMTPPSTSATWSTTSHAAVDFYTRHLGFTVAERVPGVRRRPAGQPAAAAERAAELGGPPDGRRRPARSRAAGTASTSSSTTSRREIARLAGRRACRSATRSSPVPAARRCWSSIPSGNLVELFQPAAR